MDEKDWEKCWKFTNLIILIFKPFEILVRYSIRKGIERLFTNFDIKNPSILELGAGTGSDSEWLIKKFGGKATLVDNCDHIISKSKRYFNRKKLDITCLKLKVEDIRFKNKYDLVFSVGLVEHFYNKDLYKIFRKHVDAAKKGGYIIIFVPNNSLIYRSYRRLLTLLRLWMWDEISFNIKDIENLAGDSNSKLLRTTEVICGMWLGAIYKKTNAFF